jgi:hypothetical protein
MNGKQKSKKRRLVRLPKLRRVEAHALELGQFRHNVVASRANYSRKVKHKEQSNED